MFHVSRIGRNSLIHQYPEFAARGGFVGLCGHCHFRQFNRLNWIELKWCKALAAVVVRLERYFSATCECRVLIRLLLVLSVQPVELHVFSID